MPNPKMPVSVCAIALAVAADALAARTTVLEEVIVTAQMRQESLQQTPVSVAVLGRDQLWAQGIDSLDVLQAGAIPSLRIMNTGNPSSTLVMTIRGNGPIDLTPITREPSVGVYLDGIYLARPIGLNMEVPDLERIEVLRGPQGTLFGRNTTAGAVSLISRKPTGEFGLEQTLGVGNYNAFTSVTRVNLPEFAGLRAKFDYIHSERDGWVENSAPGQWDFNESRRDGGRLGLLYAPIDQLTLEYAFTRSRSAATSSYFQVWQDNMGLVGNEPRRVEDTREPILLRPAYTYQDAHAFTATWEVSPQLTVKALTGYRDIDEETYTSWGSSLYFNGAVHQEDIDERQFSQEFQLLGKTDRFEWVAGLYYFDSHATQVTDMTFALDSFGLLPGNAGRFNVPIDPPTSIDPFTGLPNPTQKVAADTTSSAAYGQLTWTPPVLDDRLHLTLGGRYTRDEKEGARWVGPVYTPYDLDSDHWDGLVSADYALTDDVSVYAKYSTAYRSGSVNPRSASFEPFGEEEIAAYEIGLKSEWWERRARLNATLFRTEYDDLQFDFNSRDLQTITITETLNAARQVRVEGVELDLTVTPVAGLVFGLNYTYLDDDMPLQPNPLAGGALEEFQITQTPRHAGAVSADYTFAPLPIGTVVAHLDATSTSRYYYHPQNPYRRDAYTLFNARLALREIPVGAGSLEVAAWGKNLTDEEYVVFSFTVGAAAILQSFADPRTYGMDVTYRY